MANSRDKDDESGKHPPHWQNWSRQFIELANAAGRGPGAESGEDVLWRQPLLLWEQAASRMLVAESSARRIPGPDKGALHAYQRALLEYGDALRGVSAKALADVSATWPERQTASGPPAGLRELFDLYVDLGEKRYYELVSSEKFAEIGGRLINNLVECVHLGWKQDAAQGSSARTEHAESANFPGILAELGFGLEQTLAELRAFGEKLDAGVATLRNLGDIQVGTSEKEVVLRDGKLTLFRYVPTIEPTNPVPVLIVYALANRPYMMDLQPQRSLIRRLMDMGLEVYLIDWGYPDRNDTKLGLDDYINGFIDGCVERIRADHGVDGINLLGVCQGGTFSLCYAALHPDKIRNLVLMVTPVDFHTPDNLLTTWLRHVDVDRLVDVLGNVPGELLNWAFVSMKPLTLTGQKYLDMLNLLDDEDKARTFLRMEKWIHDSPAQAGECFRQFAKDLFQKNKLVEGSLQVGERVVDLRKISMPVLNVYATQDHIVPPDASLALEGRIASSDYTTFAFEGGHIGIYVSARAQREVPQKIADWLQTRCDCQAETSP
jgi:polyhydroxyalkanoate synthase